MPLQISSVYASLHVKTGRVALAELIKKSTHIPVIITGDIVAQLPGEDFEVAVSGVTLGTPRHPQAVIPVGDVHDGSILIADGGFSCLSEGQQCHVRRDRKGELCVECRCGHHGLEGQLDRRRENYVGFYLKGAPSRYNS